MPRDQEILKLKKRILSLENENEVLRNENEVLRKRLGRARGLPGEQYVLELTGGRLTKYKDGHDVEMENGTLLEVKLSKLNTPGGSKTKRWNWSKVLGLNDTKTFDFLVLLGEKDTRYEDQYPPDLDYVCFLVPRSDVNNIKNSYASSVALNTNLATARARQAEALKRYLVRSREQFKDLSPNGAAP